MNQIRPKNNRKWWLRKIKIYGSERTPKLSTIAKFLDVHPVGEVNEETLKKMQNELPDEFGVITENILYNIEDDNVFCLIEAPSKELSRKTSY